MYGKERRERARNGTGKEGKGPYSVVNGREKKGREGKGKRKGEVRKGKGVRS